MNSDQLFNDTCPYCRKLVRLSSCDYNYIRSSWPFAGVRFDLFECPYCDCVFGPENKILSPYHKGLFGFLRRIVLQ